MAPMAMAMAIHSHLVFPAFSHKYIGINNYLKPLSLSLSPCDFENYILLVYNLMYMYKYN